MNRRTFTKMTGMGVLAVQSFPTVTSAMISKHESEKSTKVPLGIGNHSLRALKPNAIQLIEYAVEHRLDSVQFNTLKPFESLEDGHLVQVKQLAKANDISIYVGVGSICEKSVRFNDEYGNAKTLLKEGIRVARALGSPIVGVRIGVLADRYTEGGIKPKIEEVVQLMKSMREPVGAAGIKFAFENHAGDMRSEELLELIYKTGEDICGAFFDPGNAIYAMEDPKSAMKLLGSHIIACQARDVMVWGTEDGAMFQWTAVGDGMMDFNFFTKYLGENCPGVPIHLETISNSPRSIPYLKAEYWDGFPDLPASGIIDFLKLLKEGQPMEMLKPSVGIDKKDFDIKLQKTELLRSFEYLRKNCNIGLKS
jgi:sugar phosphate isomerase/epimerase